MVILDLDSRSRCKVYSQTLPQHNLHLHGLEQAEYKFLFWFEFLLHRELNIQTTLQSHYIRRQLKKIIEYFKKLITVSPLHNLMEVLIFETYHSRRQKVREE